MNSDGIFENAGPTYGEFPIKGNLFHVGEVSGWLARMFRLYLLASSENCPLLRARLQTKTKASFASLKKVISCLRKPVKL